MRSIVNSVNSFVPGGGGGSSISEGVRIFQHITEKLVPGGPYRAISEKLVPEVHFRAGGVQI